MKRLYVAFLLMISMIFYACPHANAHQRDQIYICAKDMKTEKMYHAAAYTATGAELNGLSKSPIYDPVGDYLVVLWNPTHVSIMTMNGEFASPNSVPTTSVDESGNEWEISTYSPSVCP